MYKVSLDKVKTYNLDVNRASIAITKAKWGEISGNITEQLDLKEELDKKANVDNVYTKEETDQKYQIAGDYATNSDLATKADSDDVYSKIDADSKFAKKADIPSKVSQLVNDAGYINDVSDKADKAEIADMLTKTDAANVYATKETVADMDQKVDVAISNANAAASNANTAADRVDEVIVNANTATSKANTAAENANTAATNADAKANLANSAASAAVAQTNRLDNLANHPPKIEDDNWLLYDEATDTYTIVASAKGVSGVFVGSGDMPDGYNIQIDPDGDVIPEDSLVTKEYLENQVYSKAEIDAMISQIYAAINAK